MNKLYKIVLILLSLSICANCLIIDCRNQNQISWDQFIKYPTVTVILSKSMTVICSNENKVIYNELYTYLISDTNKFIVNDINFFCRIIETQFTFNELIIRSTNSDTSFIYKLYFNEIVEPDKNYASTYITKSSFNAFQSETTYVKDFKPNYTEYIDDLINKLNNSCTYIKLSKSEMYNINNLMEELINFFTTEINNNLITTNNYKYYQQKLFNILNFVGYSLQSRDIIQSLPQFHNSDETGSYLVSIDKVLLQEFGYARQRLNKNNNLDQKGPLLDILSTLKNILNDFKIIGHSKTKNIFDKNLNNDYGRTFLRRITNYMDNFIENKNLKKLETDYINEISVNVNEHRELAIIEQNIVYFTNNYRSRVSNEEEEEFIRMFFEHLLPYLKVEVLNGKQINNIIKHFANNGYKLNCESLDDSTKCLDSEHEYTSRIPSVIDCDLITIKLLYPNICKLHLYCGDVHFYNKVLLLFRAYSHDPYNNIQLINAMYSYFKSVTFFNCNTYIFEYNELLSNLTFLLTESIAYYPYYQIQSPVVINLIEKTIDLLKHFNYLNDSSNIIDVQINRLLKLTLKMTSIKDYRAHVLYSLIKYNLDHHNNKLDSKTKDILKIIYDYLTSDEFESTNDLTLINNYKELMI